MADVPRCTWGEAERNTSTMNSTVLLAGGIMKLLPFPVEFREKPQGLGGEHFDLKEQILTTA